MILYQQLRSGVFLACDTETGIAELAEANSYWARRARYNPLETAGALLARTTWPDTRKAGGKKVAKRNTTIIQQLQAHVAAKEASADS